MTWKCNPVTLPMVTIMLLHDKGKIQYADEMHAQRHETMFLGGYTFAWGI